MSYILDALKKAERERGMIRAPAPLVTDQLRAGHGNRPWIIAGTLVACIAAALWIFLPSMSTVPQSPNSVRTGAEQDHAAGRADVKPAANSIPPNAAPSPIPAAELAARAVPGLPSAVPVSPESKAGALTTAPPATGTVNDWRQGGMERTAGGTRRAVPATRPVTLPQPSRQEPQVPPAFENAPPQDQPGAIAVDQPTKDMKSVPHEVQRETMSLREAMEKMNISVLIYAEAKTERRVYINGKKYLEGDYVDGRYLIESISLEGVVLSSGSERATLRTGSR